MSVLRHVLRKIISDTVIWEVVVDGSQGDDTVFAAFVVLFSDFVVNLGHLGRALSSSV